MVSSTRSGRGRSSRLVHILSNTAASTIPPPLPPVEMAPSNNTLSSTASHSSAISTALSQSYLTPASSVSSCRSDSNPHVTGTIQPYLKRAPGQVQRRNTKEDHSGPVSSDSTESVDNQHRTSSTLSASRRGTGRRRATTGTAKQTCVQRQSSSTVSFKTAKASSTVSLRTNKSASSFQTAPSSVSLKTSKSRESSKTTASSTSLQSPRCLDTAESLNTESSQAAHSMQSVATSTGVSSTTAGHNLHPPTLSGPQDLSPGSTLTSPALSQCERDSQQNTPTETIPVTGLPSRVFMTGVQLPPGKQKETISLVELDQLWMDFLASSLGAQQPEKRSLVRRPAAHTALQPTTCGSGEESLREQCSFETRDTAIQTTPSLALSSKPIAFGVTSHQNQHTFQQVHTHTHHVSVLGVCNYVNIPFISSSSHHASHTSHYKSH